MRTYDSAMLERESHSRAASETVPTCRGAFSRRALELELPGRRASL